MTLSEREIRIMNDQIKDCGIQSVYENIHLYQQKFRLHIEQEYRKYMLKNLDISK